MKMFFRKFRTLILVISLTAASIAALSFTEDYFEVTRNIDIFVTLFRELNANYVDEIKPGALIKKGIDSMLESLDPYTNYIPESDIEDYRFMTTGQYGGIGALIGQRGDEVIITEPYENYPAQKAGLQAGDVLVEIDGKPIKGKKYDEVSKILKGQPKTSVKIKIRREGEKELLEKTVTREEIKISNVPYSGIIGEDIGYIRLTGFTENAGMEVKNAFTELKAKKPLKGLILDLRGNPGGLLHEAVNIVNIFIPKGQEVVTTKGKIKDAYKTYKTLSNPVDTELPLAVLVNSMSASASEIVSGAIQDLDRGITIGQRTFGKGLVQTTRPLSYNAQLKVTTAKYYIPSGRCIQAVDYTHRKEDGSVGKIPDSLISEFKTKSGRIVYDGGGIIPDFITSPRYVSPITRALISNYLIFDYATFYRQTHPSIPPAKEFKLTDTEYDAFVKWLEPKEYDYSTKSEKALEELKKFAEKEKYFAGIREEYEQLHKKMMHDKTKDLYKYKEEIMELLQSEIASRYYYQNGRIESGFYYDEDIKKAVEALSNPKVYAQIMNRPPLKNPPVDEEEKEE
jgi:carboxyl-terminal processing protease